MISDDWTGTDWHTAPVNRQHMIYPGQSSVDGVNKSLSNISASVAVCMAAIQAVCVFQAQ